MNCLEFRRRLLEEPNRSEADYLAHADQCPGCQAEYRRCLQLEQDLRSVLQVSPPPELRDEIIQQQSRTHAGGASRRRPWLLSGLAASLLLGIGIGTKLTLFHGAALDQQVIDHIAHEMPLLQGPADHWVDNARLHRLFTDLGGELSSGLGLGRVRHAGRCHMGKGEGLHLVLQGERGPVTLLLMPEQPIDGALPVQAGELQGIILPMQQGSVAVVGNSDEPVLRIGEQVRNAVRWRL